MIFNTFLDYTGLYWIRLGRIMIPPHVEMLLQSLQRTNTKIKLQAVHDLLIPVYNRRGFIDIFNKAT